MFENILRDEQVERVVSKGKTLEIFASIPVKFAAERPIFEKEGMRISRAVAAYEVVAGRRLMQGEGLPSWKIRIERQIDRAKPGNGTAALAEILISEPY